MSVESKRQIFDNAIKEIEENNYEFDCAIESLNHEMIMFNDYYFDTNKCVLEKEIEEFENYAMEKDRVLKEIKLENESRIIMSVVIKLLGIGETSIDLSYISKRIGATGK